MTDIYTSTRRAFSLWTSAIFAACTLVVSVLNPTAALAASRSVHVIIRNDTGFNLALTRGHLDGGIWAGVTPMYIGPYGDWGSESNGLWTGTQGFAIYRIVDVDNNYQGRLRLDWDNPYSGHNSYSESVTPAGNADGSGFSVGHIGGGGDNAEVTFRVLSGLCQIDPNSGETACTSSYAVHQAGTCVQGYVWREAFDGDLVCVTSDTRAQAAADNSQADQRRQPGAGDICRQGYVWREASPQDHVCVTPETRARAASDNAQAQYLVAP